MISCRIFSQESNDEVIAYEMNGFTLALGGFDYFSIGAGYNWGEGKIFHGHGAANVHGVLLEYKTMDELHLRFYSRLLGGSAGMLLGLSSAVVTNFDTYSVGIAPEIGIGIGTMNLFYRYNFYIDSSYNCHEVVLCVYPINYK